MLVEPVGGVAQAAEVLEHTRRVDWRITAARPERAHCPAEPEQRWELRHHGCVQASYALVASAERLGTGPGSGLLPDPHGHPQGHRDIQATRRRAGELKVDECGNLAADREHIIGCGSL